MAIGPGVIWEMVIRSVNSAIEINDEERRPDSGSGGCSITAEAKGSDLKKTEKKLQVNHESVLLF